MEYNHSVSDVFWGATICNCVVCLKLLTYSTIVRLEGGDVVYLNVSLLLKVAQVFVFQSTKGVFDETQTTLLDAIPETTTLLLFS